MFSSEQRPLILVTNDDGVNARGINCLAESLRGLGRVIVVAPDSPRSGHSCSFTSTHPIEIEPVSDDGDVTVFQTTGTPVDCVKLALHRLFEHRRPDLIVSGINHGANSSVCVVYSGTMGAVIEGCIVGIPAVGFSICDHSADADFTHAVGYCRQITERVMNHGLQPGICLNVNIPKGDAIKGIRVCRQADGYWCREFNLLEEQPQKAIYQVTGEYANREPDADDTDEYLLAHGYVSVVPTHIDLTAYRAIAAVKFLED